jgi:monoamine oxidase
MKRSMEDAIVVGAGAAGLAAARALSAAGLSVVVLEARDRVGGRAFTLAHPGLVAPIELGAEYVHGSTETMQRLITQHRVISIETAESGWEYREGRLEPMDDRFGSAEQIVSQVDMSEGRDLTVDAFLQQFARDDELRDAVDVVRMMVTGFDAADPRIASMQDFAREWYGGASLQAASSRLVGGYGALFSAMLAAIDRSRVRVVLDANVEEIVRHEDGVEVQSSRFGEAFTCAARAAIITLPIGVLHAGTIRFLPELPEQTHSAIDSIAMGEVFKVVAQFRDAFWQHIEEGRYRGIAFIRAPEFPFPAFWTAVPTELPLMTAWAGGPAASALRDLSGDEIIRQAVAEIGTLFGIDAASLLETAHVHNWNADPFSRGAYSYLRAGAGDARERLSEAVDGVLFFAGEATAPGGFGGTVTGAFNSGTRAALALVDALTTAGITAEVPPVTPP